MRCRGPIDATDLLVFGFEPDDIEKMKSGMPLLVDGLLDGASLCFVSGESRDAIVKEVQKKTHGAAIVPFINSSVQ